MLIMLVSVTNIKRFSLYDQATNAIAFFYLIIKEHRRTRSRTTTDDRHQRSALTKYAIRLLLSAKAIGLKGIRTPVR